MLEAGECACVCVCVSRIHRISCPAASGLRQSDNIVK